MTSQIELLNGRVTIGAGELLGRSGATDRDIVVLSGTLLEGFGNLYSDLDLYVIGDDLPVQSHDGAALSVVREDGRVRRVNETLTESANILLDVQYYTFRELDTLTRSLSTLYLESRQSTGIFRKTLHHEDEDLIHKLLTGTILQDGTGTFDADEIFDPGMFCFLKYRNHVGGYAEFRDLVGSWTAGDLNTCLFNTRDYLIAQVAAMMFLAGSSNPRPKWFIRKLESLDEEYSRLRDGVMLWLNSERWTEQQKREGVETACDLIDLTYSYARRLLDTNRRYFSAEEALALTEREFAERSTRDRDTLAEWQLRRRIFSRAESPLFTQLESQAPQTQRSVMQSTLPARASEPAT
jgi:hypothetical protein